MCSSDLGLLKPEQHLSIAADITDESQVRHAYEQVLACKGRIDWLINNAGLSQRALIEETGKEGMQRLNGHGAIHG